MDLLDILLPTMHIWKYECIHKHDTLNSLQVPNLVWCETLWQGVILEFIKTFYLGLYIRSFYEYHTVFQA